MWCVYDITTVQYVCDTINTTKHISDTTIMKCVSYIINISYVTLLIFNMLTAYTM